MMIMDSTIHFKTLAHRQNKVGVCYFKDWQGILPNVFVYLPTTFWINYPIKMYDTFEYGETTNRPHIHFLAKCRPCDEEKIRLAIVQAWPFADSMRTYKNIELPEMQLVMLVRILIAVRLFRSFLRTNFKPKHSF